MLVSGGIVLVLAATCTLTQGLFPPGSSLTYQYYGIVRAGTLTPIHGSSDWEISGNLYVQSLGNEAVLQFSDLAVSLYNGKPGEKSEPDQKYLALPVEAGELLQPFVVHYDTEKAAKISVAVNESVWSVNIKRAIASILRLEETKLNQSAFMAWESNLYGHCMVEYSVIKENNKIVARKFIDHFNCDGFPRKSWSNVSPLICSAGRTVVTSTSGRLYILSTEADGSLKLEKVLVNSGVDIQPFHARGELNYAFVNQTLELKSTEKVEDLTVPEDIQVVGLTYELPGLDATQGRGMDEAASEQLHLKMVDLYTRKLSENLEINPMKTDTDILHNEYVPHILYFLSLVSKPSLKEYYSSLAIGTSYQQETRRNLFLKLLPQVGSDATILLIRDLVKNGQVKEKAASELLAVLPFFIRHPSETLLKECETFLSLGDDIAEPVKRSAILTFSIMVYKICLKNCSPPTLEYYIRYFVDRFSNSHTYSEQMLYLETLNNVELGSVFDHLTPVIQGNASVYTEQPHHIRFIAVWASMSRAPYNPHKVSQLYWPILTNRSEHVEMRVAALTMLILAGPTHGTFVNLLWFMQSEPNAHLQHFFYTTLESLIDTQYPCYTKLGQLASHIIRYVRPPATRTWATGNYIVDYSDPQHGFGGLAQLFAIANQRTGNPNVFYLLMNSHALGHSLRQFAIYLKLEGVAHAANEMMFKSKSLSINDVTKLLQDIKAPTISPERIHIEIILKVEERVIYCQYINHTDFHKLAEVVGKMNFLSREFHINFQTIKAPVMMEVIQPTDLGVPLLLQTDASVVTSIRGNFTKDTVNVPFARKNQIDIRYAFNSGSSVTVYNPLNNLWHSSRRSVSYQSHIPLNNRISVHPGEQQLKFSFMTPTNSRISFVAHSRSSVTVRGKDSTKILGEYCPSCSKNVIVTEKAATNDSQELLNITIPDLGINFKSAIFDCEHTFDSHNLMKLLQDMVSDSNKNFRVLPLSRTVLGFLHTVDLLTLVPPHGSCGLRFDISSTNVNDTEVECVLQFTLDGTLSGPSRKYILKQEVNVKGSSSETPLKSWQAVTSYEVSQEEMKHALKSHVTRLHEGKPWHEICFDGEAIFPKQTNGLVPWNITDNVTAKASIIWGAADKIYSKDGAEFVITARGEVTKEQRELTSNVKSWPHQACLEDSKNEVEWGSGYTPITEACYRAAVEVATLRKYTASLKYNNVPESLKAVGRRVGAIIDALSPGISTQASDESQPITASIEIPLSKPHAIIKVNQGQLTLPQAGRWLEPFLINTCVDMVVSQAMKVGVLGSCIVNSAKVISIDNSTHPFTASSCFTLVAADCSQFPHFAVLVRRVAGSKPLAVKLYINGQIIEITPASNGSLKIFLNNEQLVTDKHGYSYPPEKKVYHWLIQQLEEGLVRVISDVSQIWLQHNGHFLTLVVPGFYRGQLCGLCGDFNGDASNDTGEIMRLPCED